MSKRETLASVRAERDKALAEVERLRREILAFGLQATCYRMGRAWDSVHRWSKWVVESGGEK